MTHLEENTLLSFNVQDRLLKDEDYLRKMMEKLVQEVLESEIKSFLQAESYERTDNRKGYRNGYKSRTFHTRVGTLELMVPKDREGQFQTELFERYQRSEKALMLSVAQMYIEGVSTRKIKKITEVLCGLDISKSQVSELSKRLDGEVATWRMRKLDKDYVYLVADARYEHIRKAGSVTPNGVLIVIGIDKDGYREPLGVWVADSESEASWSNVFNSLKKRGLRGVKYVVSDDHKGLKKAVFKCFQGALWQRCQVHFIRNILGVTARKNRPYIMSLLRDIIGSRCTETARRRIRETVELLEHKYPKIAEKLDEDSEEILSVYNLPESHRKKMRTTNMLERLNQEIKRRTRVVRIFPDEKSCIRLVSSLLMETADDWMMRKYMDPDKIDEEQKQLKQESAA